MLTLHLKLSSFFLVPLKWRLFERISYAKVLKAFAVIIQSCLFSDLLDMKNHNFCSISLLLQKWSPKRKWSVPFSCLSEFFHESKQIKSVLKTSKFFAVVSFLVLAYPKMNDKSLEIINQIQTFLLSLLMKATILLC